MAHNVGLTLTWIFFSLSILKSFSQTSPFEFLATSCKSYPKFNNGSQYESNLKTLFKYLSSNTSSPNGYHQAISGNGNDTVYGHFLCRGDQNASSCRDCVTYAITTKLPETCRNRKFAIIWFDECMIKYSYNPFFGYLDLEWIINYKSSTPIRGNKTEFLETRKNMMVDRITDRASKGGSKKFATDYQNITDFRRNVTIYGLGQCTPDLSEDDCKTCLLDAIDSYEDFDGGRVFHFSCIARYEVKPFFDLSTVRPWPAPLPPPPSETSLSTGISTKAILAIVIPLVTVLMGLIGIGICFFKRKKPKTYYDVVDETGDDFINVESLQYDLAMLQSATNNFSNENKLGEGGFGGVYKATLSNGQEVAVKRLSNTTSNQGVEQFKNEVLLVAKLHHRNLVRLLGFCLEGQEKILVYEYIPNKSLDKFLFETNNQMKLGWETRYKMIGGIARGMVYLHQDSQLRIIHRDLKASNVLVDADMNPKISDFGTARIFGADQSQDNTNRVVGTYGYMSPEYAMHGQFSNKSDVYSFGVLILETISGKRNNVFYQSGEAGDLPSYAWKQWRDGTVMEFVDSTIRDSCSIVEIMRCIHLGLLCVQESPDDRPTMATIVLNLESYSITLPVPKNPGFFIKNTIESKIINENSSDQSSYKRTNWSSNDVSITELGPR